MKDMERRNFPVDEIRVVRAEDTPPKIAGHAEVFNSLSEDLGGFREKINPGAFAKAINKDDIRALFNHDSNHVLGRNKAGKLRLAEDNKGLAVEIDPPDTQTGRDLMVSIERGDINQMSFGFRVLKQEWDESGDEVIRTLKEVDLFDVSPVTFPANLNTNVGVRELRNWQKSQVPVWRKAAERKLKLFEAENI